MPFIRLMGIIPVGIGMTALGFLWLAPWGFGGPPLFFRVFASFIALGFLLQGGAMLYGMHPKTLEKLRTGRFKDLLDQPHRQSPDVLDPSATSYNCRSCDAPLGRNADVSPLGDVKCSHCGKWFNIHGRVNT